MTGKKSLRVILAWILLVVMGVNNFAGSVISVQATGYGQDNMSEKASDANATNIEDTMTEEEEIVTEESNTVTKEPDTVMEEESGTDYEKEIEQIQSQTEETVSVSEQTSIGEIQQLYSENGVIEEDVSIYQPTILMCDITVNGNVRIYGDFDLNGHTLTVNGTMEQYVNFSLKGTVIVHGGYNWVAGSLDFVRGRLYIDQNMDIIQSGDKSWQMVEDEAYLCVGGDIILGYYDKLVTNITAGIIELKGNFIQNVYNYVGTIQLPESDFITEGTNRLLLSGNQQQTIYISKETSKFEYIEVVTQGRETEEEGVYDFHNQVVSFSQYCNYESYESHGCHTNYGFTEIELTTLTEDSYVYGNGYLKEGVLNLDAYTLYIQGNFVQNGNVILGTGRLYISGDYRIQSLVQQETDIEYAGNSAMVDSTKNSYVYIMGDFVTESDEDHKELLTNGNWYFYGNITQKGKSTHNFATGGEWKGIIQNGKQIQEEQLIHYDNPMGNPLNAISLNDYSCKRVADNGIYVLHRTGDGVGCIEADYYIDNVNKELLGYTGYNNDVVIVGKLELAKEVSLPNGTDIYIRADLTIDSTYLNCNNIIIEQGTVHIKNGEIYAKDVTFADGGTGRLYMEDENAVLRCRDFYIGSNISSGVLSAGRIVIEGKLTQKNTGTPDNFVTTERMEVYLEGSGDTQIVHFDSMESEMEKLYIRSGSQSCTVFETEVNVHNLYDEYHRLRRNGLIGYTLEQDVTYFDNIQLCGGVLDLNGHTLIAEKNFILSGGTINLNGGSLIIKGDFRCQDMYEADEKIVYEAGCGNIIMNTENDYIQIEKDWYIQLQNVNMNAMSMGEIRLAGNLIIQNDAYSNYSQVGRRVIGEANLVLNGSGEQDISWSGTEGKLYVKNLCLDNAEKVTGSAIMYVDGTVSKMQEGKIMLRSLHVNAIDSIACENIETDVYVEQQGTMQHNLTVDGTLYLMGRTDINGYTLQANTIYMYSCMQMNHSEDTVRVTDFYVCLNYYKEGFMTNGTIFIDGNFQENREGVFQPSDNHTIVFNHANEDKVSIIFANENSKMNIAILKGKLNEYSLNREKDEIANKVIMDYEDEEKPVTPENLTYADKTCRTITLVWDEAYDNMEIEKYIVYRDGVQIATTHKTSYVDKMLEYGTAYCYTVQAKDAKGNLSDKSLLLKVVTNSDDAEPEKIKTPSVAATDSEVKINFSNCFTDKESYIDYYVILRDGKEIAHVPAEAYVSYKDIDGTSDRELVHRGTTTYTDTTVEKRMLYEYAIYAVDMADNCSEMYKMKAVTDPLPEAPSDFSVVSENSHNYITFEKSGLRECYSYSIYRKTEGDNRYYELVEILNDKQEYVTYEDKQVVQGLTYYYQIRPYNAEGVKGSNSKSLSVITSKDQIMPEITSVQYEIEGDIINEDMQIIVNASDNGMVKEIGAYYTKEGETEQHTIRCQQVKLQGRYGAARFLFATDDLQGVYVIHMYVKDQNDNYAETEKTVQVHCTGIAAVTGCKASATENSVILEWDAVDEAAQYRVEQLYGNSYASCGDTEKTTMTISNLNSSQEYTFRVVAYDKDNIRGRNSEVVAVTTLEDKEIPVIQTVNDNEMIYGEKTPLWLSYADNVAVGEVIAQYRMEGEEEWKLVGETHGCGAKGSVQIAWDKTELSSGRYELRYQIADKSGNMSEEVIRTAVIDKEPPIIKGFTLVPGDWSVTLQWDSITENDYAGYRLYRIHMDGTRKLVDCGTKNHSYTEQISPKEVYTYELCVWDSYDNIADEKVQGTSVNHDVIAPKVSDIPDVLAATQMVTKLTAPSCSDNDEIKEYTWNMGNGDVVTGESCEYIYSEPGEYEASLTVEDDSGNQTIQKFHITVGADIGILEVRVTDQKGLVIKDADVVLRLNGNIYHSGMVPKTNSQGIVRYPLSEGTYQVAAYKEGYTPLADTVEMKKGIAKNLTLALASNSMIDAKVTTKQLTYDEMVKEGIDTDGNQMVYRHKLKLEYEKEEIPTLEFDNRNNKKEWSWQVPTYTITPDGKKEESTGKRSIHVKDVSDDPGTPVFMVTQTEQIEISWLANIYKVNITICNNAGELFGLQDTIVTLDIDDPLQMADMKDGTGNDREWIVGELAGGESATHSWYVTGKKEGTYDIKANIDAHIPYLDKKISQEAIAKNAITITAGKGLHLYIYPEENAYIGEKYYIQYKLKNESDENYYNVTTNFGSYDSPDMVMENVTLCTYEEDGRVEVNPNAITLPVKLYIPNQDGMDKKVIKVNGTDMTIKKLKPGEAIYGTSVKLFSAAGNVNEEYYKLVNQYVEEVNSNNTGVKVTVQPVNSHLSKTVQKKTVKKESDDKLTYKKRKKEDEENDDDEMIPSTPGTDQTVKDPVNLMTGAFQSEHVLASVAGGNDAMEFRLTYNSLSAGADGELGYGWSHNYEMRLERTGDFITLYLNPGNRMCFVESEETRQLVSGRIESDEIILEDDSFLQRIYYQVGSDSQNYRITKNADGYTVKLGTQEYRFDTEGKLTECIAEDGERVLVDKTETQLTITNEATGKKIIAEYDKEGRIVAVADQAGNSSRIAYENDNLEKIAGKNGLTLTYVYDKERHIVKGMEGEDVFVENTYNKEGRVLSQIANGNKADKTMFTYVTDSGTGNLTVTMTNADGTTEKAVSDRYGQGLSYENAIGGVTTYLYNDNSDMTAYEEPDGTGKSYTYDQKGNIVSVTETTGKEYRYTYDEEGRVTSVTGNDGMNVKYTYNERGQKKTISSSTGLNAEYTYNDNGQVLTEKSNLGTLTYHYEKGMLTSLTDQSGNIHSFVYDANGNVIQYTDGNGTVTDYKVDVSGRVLSEAVELSDGQKAVTIYTYDPYGNVLSEMDPLGNTTAYTYDEDGHMTSETRPDGSVLQYAYDQNGNLTKVVYPDGETIAAAVYDAAGNTLSLTDTLKSVQTGMYSAGSQLLSLTQANGGEVTYTYYDNGLLQSQTDANGNTITLSYDSAGRVVATADAAGNTTTYSYDKDGNLEKIEDALGKSTDFGYNEYRKVIRQKDANGNVTTYDYDKALNCIRVTDAEQGVTEFTYDANGQITSMTKKGETEEQDITLSMTYDNLGNVTSLTDGEGNVRRMEYDLASNLKAVYDAKGVKIAEYTYDALGNQETVTDALGNVTENSYDCFGNLVKQMNEATGEVNTYSYVGGRYLAESTDTLGNTASMTYDSMGNAATLTNPNGGVTTYQYDLNNNLTDEIIGEAYHVRYTYNALNLTASKTNSRDQQTTYTYDALGRLVHQEDEAGVIDYTYDGNGNVLTVTENVDGESRTITRTYDGLNRVTSYEDAKGHRIGYEYDKLGNLSTLTYPKGKKVRYTYDKNCNIKTVTDWKNRTTTYSYDANGRLVKTERPDGTVETREYDKAGRLTLILDQCGDTEVNRQEYSYDAAGNITTVKNLADGNLDFTGVDNAEMTYDKNNRLLTYNGEHIEYDQDGNMTYGPLQGKMTAFVYDCRNRLIQAGDTTYEYDAENNRIAVTADGKRTDYVINTQPELSQILQSITTDGTAQEITCYFYGNGLIAQEDGEDYLTYHFNNVGSTMAVTDQAGKVTASYDYTPYGQFIRKEADSGLTIPFLYNGQFGVTTDESGLYYMRARYYNVDIKRFMNQDVLTGTLERISSLNRYAYAEGNPVSYLDPFGLEAYDTSTLHQATFIIGLVNFVVGLINPNAAIFISTSVNGFDIGLYLYDGYYDIKEGNLKEVLNDLKGVIIDLIGILTIGIAKGYLKVAEEATGYNGIMYGYEHQLSALYDEWNYIDTVASRGNLVAQIIKKLDGFCEYLRKKWKERGE